MKYNSYIIASLIEYNMVMNKPNRIGYKVLTISEDYYENKKDGVVLDLLKDSSIIKKYPNGLKNAVYKDNKIVGTQGSLDRYPQLNVFDGNLIYPAPFVILGKNLDGYYLVVINPKYDCESIICTVSPYQLKYLLKTHPNDDETYFRLANGRINKTNNLKEMVIKPIKGSFDVIVKSPKYIEKEFNFGENKETKSATKWKVRVIQKGQSYGNMYKINNTKKNIVEFYDLDCDFEKFPEGQAVSSYYLDNIIEHNSSLDLVWGSEKWYISRENLKQIQQWLQSLELEK